MKNSFQLLLPFLLLSVALHHVSGFVSPLSRHCKSASLSMALTDVPPPASSAVVAPVSFNQQMSITTSSINDGIGRFVAQDSPTAIMSSTNVLSLKERPPPPTDEEIAAKKLNFNLWFWGGGFVAPFLATFYYFGLQFWKR